VLPEPDPAWTSPRTRNLVVVETRIVATDTVTMRLEARDGQALPDYLPGQHLTLGHPGDAGTVRSYSLTGPAVDPERYSYEIAVRKVPGGRFSSAVHEQFRPGTVVQAGPPSGLFTIPLTHPNPIVLIAAGVGITPFLSYLETLRHHAGAAPEVVLFHGNRDRAGHTARERIVHLQRALPTLTVVTYYSRVTGEVPAGVRHGRFDPRDVQQDLIDRGARFYHCGPETMLEQVSAELVRRGAHRFAVFTEKFHAAAVHVAPVEAATVTFARTGASTRWGAGDGTLLQLAERSGLRPPSGCRVGQCESCAVTVVRGTVAHLVPAPEDLPADQCLTCQAVPMSDVVLDL
jgi:ferredoxin-NADP reductase